MYLLPARQRRGACTFARWRRSASCRKRCGGGGVRAGPPPTTFEETVERLGTAIRLGLLAPGTRLPPERELADQLGSPARRCARPSTTLVQSGHLVSVRGRAGGTFVAERRRWPSAARRAARRRRLRAVLDYRVAIEIGAAMLAAERARAPRTSTGSSELVEKMADAPRSRSTAAPTSASTSALAEAARSPRLVAAMTEVQGEMSELIALIAHPEEVLTRSNAQHAGLVKLLRRGDAGRGGRLMREHLEGTEHILVGLMPPAPGLRPDPLALGVEQRLARRPRPPTQRPKISTSTAVPGSASSGGGRRRRSSAPTV